MFLLSRLQSIWSALIIQCFKFFLLTLCLGMPTVTLAYDFPWNGGKEDITSPDPDSPPSCPSGNCKCDGTRSPVFVADGALIWRDTDITFPSTTPLGLKRTYNSFDYRAGLFGRGWMTAQEVSIARTFKAVTEGNSDGSPKTATEFKSVPIWLSESGRRYELKETATECTPPSVMYFTFQKQSDGRFKQVFEDKNDYSIYSADGRLLESFVDEIGTTLYYVYDNANRLIKQFDSDGFSFSFTYNDRGFVASVTDQAGRAWNYRYNDMGSLLQVQNPDGYTKDYAYQTVDHIGYQQHLLTNVFDDGNDPVLTVAWANIAIGTATQMRVASYTEIDGHRHDYSYVSTTFVGKPAVQVTKKTNQINSNTVIKSQTFIADAGNYRVLQDTNSTDKLTEKRSFDERGNLLEFIDERGNKTLYEYNDQGRRTKITALAGTTEAKTTTMAYWNNTDRIAVLNEYGLRETRFTYDSNLRMLTQTLVDLSNDQQRTITYEYHPNRTDSQGNVRLGQVASIDSTQQGNQDITRLDYNAQAQVTKITLPLNQAIAYTYNSAGQLATEVDVNGVESKLTYNSRNQLLSRTRSDRSMSYRYNAQNQLLDTTDELGRVTKFEYDEQNQLSKVIFPSGDYRQWTYLYAASYTQITQADHQADGTILKTEINQVDAESQLPINSYLDSTTKLVDTTKYNALDEPIEVVRNRQVGTTNTTATEKYTYDKEGRVTQLVDADNGITKMTYDPLEFLAKVTDANNAQTKYSYTVWGETLETSSPDTGITTYQVDASGNTINQKNANGQITQYRYDAQNRLVAVDYQDDALDVIFNYDEGQYGNGQLTSVQEGSGSTQYKYDDRGLLLQADRTLSGVMLNTAYRYNDAAEIIGMTYPSGAEITISYDNAGRLSDIKLDENSTTREIVKNVVWRGSEVKSYQHGNGISSEFIYDAAGRLIVKRFGGDQERFQNQLDQQSQITQQSWTKKGVQSNHSFQYDALGRLIRDGSNDKLDWLFGYDPVSNRLTKKTADSSASHNYVYAANSNRLNQLDSVTIERDAAGNTLNDGIRSYQYNAMNRLSQLSHIQNNVQATYSYNIMGQRVRKQSSGTLTNDVRYVYGLSGELLGEYNSAGKRIREYIYQNDTFDLVAQIEADGSIIYIHTDHLATPRLATGANGEIIWRWTSTAFGEGVPNQDSDGDGNLTTINHRFPGQFFDEESGLHYNWHRYYDPSTGRYTQSDLIGLEGGTNTYAYVEGNPISLVDPTGEIAWGLIFGGADLAWQLYQNGGNLRCVNWGDVGMSALGGGLLNALGKGAFRFKRGAEWVTKNGKVRNPHSWGATSKWMNKEGIQVLKPEQHRHHWLLERNQGIGKNMPEWLKNQPWNTNPISKELNEWLASRPLLAPLGAPSWVPEVIGGGAAAVVGDGCECP